MKHVLVSALFLSLSVNVLAQTWLSLEECYRLAEENYPMVVRRGMIERSTVLSVENVARANLPRIEIGGQATYQSEVTRIPFDMPGVEVLSKDQYRLYGEVAQTLYDGGVVRSRKAVEEARGAVEESSFEAELYAIRSRIDNLYFGILLLRAQQHQLELAKKELQVARDVVEAGVKNGTRLRSDADVLDAETLRIDQRIISASASEAVYRDMLGTFIDRTLTDDVQLAHPEWIDPEEITRPELQFFQAHRVLFDAEEDLLSTRTRPRLELFVQGGYGRPGLNMLENDFRAWYVGGVRLLWPITAYYTQRRDGQLLDIRRQMNDAQRETFLFNTRLAVGQETSEIEKYRKLIEVDRAIIDLRNRVKETAEAKLQEGVLSSADYVREVTAADQARQQLALHEIQLLMAQARLRHNAGVQ